MFRRVAIDPDLADEILQQLIQIQQGTNVCAGERCCRVACGHDSFRVWLFMLEQLSCNKPQTDYNNSLLKPHQKERDVLGPHISGS